MPGFMLWAVAALLAAPAARAAAPIRVTSIEAREGKLFIHASAEPDFTAFKLSGPPRVVIDLNGAEVLAAARQVEVHQGGIASYSGAQFDERGARVARIVVVLERDAKYDVSARGKDLILSLERSAVAGAADPDVVIKREDVAEVKNPARRVSGVTVASTSGGSAVHIAADGQIGRFILTELRNPGRLALDLVGVSGRSGSAPGVGVVKGVRLARHGDGLRIVLDARGDSMPRYTVTRAARGLMVAVGEADIAALRPRPDAKMAAPTPKPESSARPVVAQGRPRLVPVRAVDLRTVRGRTEVLVALEDAVQFEISRPDASTSILTLHGVALPERLERNLDARSLGGPVTSLASYRVPGFAGDVKVVATVAKGTADEMSAQKGVLIWKFGGDAKVAQAATTTASKAGAMAAEGKLVEKSNVYDASQYSGRKVDFNVKDIDIKNLLAAIAEISKRNLIVADDVRGSVTIKLRNVPWDQALDIVLKSKGLGREDIGNIIRIAPIETLRSEQKAAAEAYKNRQAAEPLKVRLIPVNYAQANSLLGQIKDALTERGTVSVDTRTNTLIVKDIQEALLRAEGIVRNLDTQTPEVLIEARIVEAATSFSRQAGIQWGGNVNFAPTYGNPTGLIFPNILAIAGAADDPAAPVSGLQGVSTPNFAVNMPAPIGLNNGAGLGFVFGSAGGAANLNLRLSAAENSGTIKTISSPRVVTVDNVDASISQGVSVPFSQTSAAGVSTTFIEARLELRVTPHVTQDGSIQLKIAAANNQPNPQLTGSNGQPSISRREARTEVLVKDGETTVIGGIYTRRNSEAWNEVPVLARLPVLGWLFKKKAVTDDRTELLIFVTPRIVNRSQSAVAAAPPPPDDGKQ